MANIDIKILHAALISAFPNRSALARMVRFGLEVNLATVADDANLSDVVFALVEWAESTDRLDDLLTAAQSDNPTNAALQALASSVRVPVATPASPAGGASPAVSIAHARRVLANLFPSGSRARIVAMDAGLPTQSINFDGAPVVVWASILDEAERQNCLAALLSVARAEYPNNPELRALFRS